MPPGRSFRNARGGPLGKEPRPSSSRDAPVATRDPGASAGQAEFPGPWLSAERGANPRRGPDLGPFLAPWDTGPALPPGSPESRRVWVCVRPTRPWRPTRQSAGRACEGLWEDREETASPDNRGTLQPYRRERSVGSGRILRVYLRAREHEQGGGAGVGGR